MDLHIALSIFSIVIIPIIAYLLDKKDSAQEQDIKDLKDQHGRDVDDLKKTQALLFKKHDDDVAALQALQLQIAKEHYLKHELDQRFLSLEQTFRQGFDGLSAEFKELSRTLIAHVAKEDKP